MENVIDQLLSGRAVEFSYMGEKYLIQQENNKGWDYLSLWRTSPGPVCLSRAFFDLADGVSLETIRELFSEPCLNGHTIQDILSDRTGKEI